MNRSLLLPAIAGLSLLFAAQHVISWQKPVEQATPPAPPAIATFARSVAASGLVEPQDESISIGSHLPGIVQHVFVEEGQRVRPGDPLFALDMRQIEADIQVKESELEAAEAELSRLDQMPRPEDLPPVVAQRQEAEALVGERQDALRRASALVSQRAVSEGELVSIQKRLDAAQAQLERAKAEETRLRAGSWEADKVISRTAVDRARAELAQLRTRAELHSVLAPDPDRAGHRDRVEGGDDEPAAELEVLQINIRPGEAVAASSDNAFLVLGDVRSKHVRVDIDEHDILRFRPHARAVGLVRGDTRQEIVLRFVKLDPFVIPKKSLTGDATERVDTRVLQAIYQIADPAVAARVFVGQQMDVFVDTASD